MNFIQKKIKRLIIKNVMHLLHIWGESKSDEEPLVEYDNDYDPEINQGFGTLFNYISNDNEDKIPKPNNSHLAIKKIDQGLFATITYSGFSNSAKEGRMKIDLQNWLESKGHSIQSNYMLAFYNPPFVPPMFRKNEIMVRIK